MAAPETGPGTETETGTETEIGTESGTDLGALAARMLAKAQALAERAEALEEDARTALRPRALNLADANRQWLTLGNGLRGFGHVLAWQYWYDMHGGGVLSHRYDGHDARVSFDLDYLAGRLDLAGELARAVIIDGGRVTIDTPVTLARAPGRRDMLSARASGRLDLQGLQSEFTLDCDLMICVEAGQARARLARSCRLRIDGPAAPDRAALQAAIDRQLAQGLAGRDLLPADLGQLGMVLHSAHLDHFLTFYFSESLPARPVYRVADGIGTPPAPEGWEDMVLAVSDDYLQRVVGRQMNRSLGWLHYKPDPQAPGQFVLPVVYRVDIDLGGSVDLGWFGRYSWRHRRTHWPELWIRMRGQLRDDGLAEINTTVGLAGATRPDSDRNLALFAGVARLKSETHPEKSFAFRIAMEETD